MIMTVHQEAIPILNTTSSAVGVSPQKRETLLVVEDDARMQKVLTRMFLEERYEVVVAGDGKAGFEAYQQLRPVAILLDLLLPEISGRDLCQLIRATDKETPILILSAVSQVVDKVLLLELGADDYVTKPFSPRELLARLQVALRRRKPAAAAPSVLCFGECEIDFAKMQARRSGTPCNLTAHEYKLLKFLAENAERVLSREELLNEVWGYNFYPTTRTVDNQILKLRQKLEQDPASPRHLQTIYGAGYRFVP
jgi:DNA-binding response OmpR family regulator